MSDAHLMLIVHKGLFLVDLMDKGNGNTFGQLRSFLSATQLNTQTSKMSGAHSALTNSERRSFNAHRSKRYVFGRFDGQGKRKCLRPLRQLMRVRNAREKSRKKTQQSFKC